MLEVAQGRLADIGADGVRAAGGGVVNLEPIADAPQRVTTNAKALVELGAMLRRAGSKRDPREPLREGMDLAQRCGSRAEAMFLTRRTVEMHLSGAYRKRDITSREQLPEALGLTRAAER